MSTSSRPSGLSFRQRVRLALRIWSRYLLVRRGLRTKALPVFADELARTAGRADRRPPRVLSGAVDRSLRLGPFRTRCLFGALVLYRLLREQGDEVELVIGLPESARDHAAHAWVELDGTDLGPPPGRGDHAELARFPSR